MNFASIIVDISHEKLDRVFQYIIPEELEEKVRIGVLVTVPFGKGNRMIQGYVVQIDHKPLYPVDKMKKIYEVVEKSVPIESRLIALAGWIRRNYGGTMNQALKTVLPIKAKVKEKEEKTITLKISLQECDSYLEEIRTKKNMTARTRLLEELQKTGRILKSEARGALNISDSTIKSMEKLGLIQVESERIYRNPVKVKQQDGVSIKLNDEQQKTADTIIEKMNGKQPGKPQLIFGVTGSGKTEVYMEIIAAAISKGKEAIVLIPEIALTYQTVMRFYRRFGDQIAVINSKMSQGERYDQLMRAKNGDVKIMIGPRSALFTPFSHLGLIIIDEEHEGAYKSEGVPKYHARETAIARAKMEGAMVVLGSATPSTESFYRCQTGEYELHRLTKRAKESSLPQVEIIDLREELNQGNRSIFSRRLRELICDRLNKKQQIMIFINRRGFAGFVSCRSCGEAIKCPHCDVSMTYHKGKNGEEKLVCHYCGHEKPFPKICPKCGSRYISTFGTGTQKVEMLMKKEFPQAKILRMDMDTTRNKDGHQKILEAFAGGEADILIGTQMIVKGHDFPNVTLVGIIAADMSLHASDYRATERTFQLLTQAAGRAGRGEKAGNVVIQTYCPENYAITCAASQDYESFYKKEIAYRELMKYPPVSHMTAMLITGEREDETEECAKKISAGIKKLISDHKIMGVAVIGPADGNISKVNDIYRKVIYLKSDRYEDLILCQKSVDEYMHSSQRWKDIHIQFDFDPMGNY